MIEERKMPRYLDPKSDIVFKKIFGHHPLLLKSFLNALLPLPEDSVIESLEYLNSENIPEIPALKHTIVDVRCTDQQGRHFIVEMQIEWVPAFMQRVLFNTSSAYVKQIQKGEKYTTLCPVYGLALLAHNFRENDTDWIHHYKMTHQKKLDALDDIHLVFVELSKFKPNTVTHKRLTILWLRFLAEIGEKTDVVDPELLSIPEIKEAVTLTQVSAFSLAELNAYDAYWDNVSANATLMDGKFELGRTEGQRQEKIAIAHNLLAAGLSLELIAQTTQLTIKEVQQLKK